MGRFMYVHFGDDVPRNIEQDCKAEAQGVYHLARKRIKKYVQNADFFFLEKETWEKPSRFCKILG